MSEVCKNGHEFTEENTLWHRDELRGRTRRRCKECKNDFRRKGKPTVTEMSRMATTYLHEDLEDLLSFGSTYSEILDRGGFSDWGSMYRSLKRRDRWDLIERLREKKAKDEGRGTSSIIPANPTKSKRDAGSIRFTTYAGKH